MTYKLRIRHKIPNKVFHLTLRYDDSSLNLPVIGINLTDSFQVIELTGWHIIPGFIDVNKIKLEGNQRDGNTLYVARRLTLENFVETVEEEVTVEGSVRFEKENVDVTIEGTVREEVDVIIEGTVKEVQDVEHIDVTIDGTIRQELDVTIEGTVREDVDVTIEGTVREGVENHYMISPILNNDNATDDDYDYGCLIGIYGETGCIGLKWYYDEDLDESHRINPRGGMYYNGLSSYYNDVWFKFETPDPYMTITPSMGHLNKDDDYVEININTNIYKVHISNEDMTDRVLDIEWYSDAEYTNKLFNSINTNDHILYSGYDEVWIKVSYVYSPYDYIPVYEHITVDNPEIYVTLVPRGEYTEQDVTIDGTVREVEEYAHFYRIALQNTSITPSITWYSDEECTQIISGPAATAFLFTNEDNVWAVIEGEGLISETVNFEPNTPSISIKLKKAQYNYSITIYPEEASSIATFTWYEDEELTTPISGETTSELTTSLEFVWVKVSAEGYKNEVISLDGEVDELASVEMSPDNLVINAIPMIEWETNYPNYLKTSAEGTKFPLILSNNRNEIVDYTVSVENTYTRTSQQNFTYSLPQINIGNEYSIIICVRKGYGSGGLNQTTGTYTISADNSNTITFSISSARTTEHNSEPRLLTGPAAYVWLDIMPYASENKNFDIELIGLADGAAEIDGNTVKYYDNYEDGSDVPTKEKTYCCYPNYKYYIQNVGYETLSFDGDDMFSNINLSVGRLYSNLTYTVLPNNSNRLRFGIIRVTPANNVNFCYVAYIQENQNIRFVTDKNNTNILDMIDLSNHGHTYVIDLPKQTSKTFELCFKNTDIVDKVTVTSTTGVETTVGDYAGGKRYRFTTNKEKDGSYYYDGFHITIN